MPFLPHRTGQWSVVWSFLLHTKRRAYTRYLHMHRSANGDSPVNLIFKMLCRAGAMAQRLSVLAALLEDPSLFPSNHIRRFIITWSSSFGRSDTLCWPLWVPYTHTVHICTHMHIHENNQSLKINSDEASLISHHPESSVPPGLEVLLTLQTDKSMMGTLRVQAHKAEQPSHPVSLRGMERFHASQLATVLACTHGCLRSPGDRG